MESFMGYAVSAVLLVAEFYAGLFLLFIWEGHKKTAGALNLSGMNMKSR